MKGRQRACSNGPRIHINTHTHIHIHQPYPPHTQAPKKNARVVPDDVPCGPQPFHVDELHVAFEAGEPPVVLVFEVGACV